MGVQSTVGARSGYMQLAEHLINALENGIDAGRTSHNGFRFQMAAGFEAAVNISPQAIRTEMATELCISKATVNGEGIIEIDSVSETIRLIAKMQEKLEASQVPVLDSERREVAAHLTRRLLNISSTLLPANDHTEGLRVLGNNLKNLLQVAGPENRQSVVDAMKTGIARLGSTIATAAADILRG